MSDWKNVQYKDGKLRTNNGGSGSSTFAGLDDVNFSNLADGQIPKYDSQSQKWVNANESGGGSGHTYSTTEQVVGTWIDGKPIYEKTYSITAPSVVDTSTDVINVASLNVDNIPTLVGNIKVSNNITHTGGGSFVLFYRKSTNTISCSISNSAYLSGALTITMQYTKTTSQ